MTAPVIHHCAVPLEDGAQVYIYCRNRRARAVLALKEFNEIPLEQRCIRCERRRANYEAIEKAMREHREKTQVQAP